MKIVSRFYSIALVSFLFIIFTGCASKQYFVEELRGFNYVDNEYLSKCVVSNIDSVHSEYFAVVDSMVIFYGCNAKDFSYQVFSMNTGKKIGDFCPIGHGNDEFVAVSPITQIFKEENEHKTILFAPNESKFVKWNITRSIALRTTCYEDVVTHSWRQESPVAYSKVYYIGYDTILTYFPSVHISEGDKITQQKYTVRTYSENKRIADISTFSAVDNREGTKILPENFLSLSSCIKPDGSKFVEALAFLPQINIVDIKSNSVDGFLMEGYDDYAVFETDLSNARIYYADIQATDNHIFALWYGHSAFGNNYPYECNVIHVYDWNGDMNGVIKLEHGVNRIFIDTHSQNLFCSNADKKEIFCYDISNIESKQ